MKPSLLKAERKLREWSQAEVAEALGVTIQTVSRWERGQTIPHPYYRNKLSTLFGKTAEELGLLSDADENDAVQEATSPITQSSTSDVLSQAPFLSDSTIPQNLESAKSLRGRDGLLMQLDERELHERKDDLLLHRSPWGHMSHRSTLRLFNRSSSRRVSIPSKILLTLAVIITALVAFMLQSLYHSIHVGSSSHASTMLTINMEANFYGWTDNTPEGTDIAYPTIHKSAGGVGTYSDPITFASSGDGLKPGTIIYIPYLKKYFVMEDDCSPCDSAWSNHHSYIIVIWMGGDADSNNNAQQNCESSLSRSSVSVEVYPPSNQVVDTTPLFTDSGGCINL